MYIEPQLGWLTTQLVANLVVDLGFGYASLRFVYKIPTFATAYLQE